MWKKERYLIHFHCQSWDLCDKVREKVEILINKAYEMVVYRDIDPFITLSFLSLPVIPKLRIIPRGLVSMGDYGPELLK